MPMILCNSPASCQRALDNILTIYKCKTCFIYVDDVIIYSKTVEEHFSHVQELLSFLAEVNVTLIMKKCFFFQLKVKCLRHILTLGELEISRANMYSLRNSKPKMTKTKLWLFPGLFNAHRRFIRNFSKLDQLNIELLNKVPPEKLELDEENANPSRCSLTASLRHPSWGFRSLTSHTQYIATQVHTVLREEDKMDISKYIVLYSKPIQVANRNESDSFQVLGTMQNYITPLRT